MGEGGGLRKDWNKGMQLSLESHVVSCLWGQHRDLLYRTPRCRPSRAFGEYEGNEDKWSFLAQYL